MAGRIEDYAIIGDMQSAALVGRDGSVDWLCLPRFDSPACFAGLLGDDRHGHWRIAPADGAGQASRAYQGETLILQTQWQTSTGTARVIDFMPRRAEAMPVLVRIVEGVHGTVDLDCVLRVRFGYGQVVPWVRRIDGSINAVAGPDSVWISTPVQLAGRDMEHRARFTVTAGQRIPFMLTWVESHHGQPDACDAGQVLEETRRYWAGWVSRCTYRGPYREAVIRSLITLKALTYEPTGGIVAAATTSLPEDIGGIRNWDYRYCWLRDATITLEALLRTGYTEEATAWRQWLCRAIAGDPADVQIMYGVAGERRLAEWEADWLPGYEESVPVRIGNAAVNQRQLDVYGEVVDALALARRSGIPAEAARLVTAARAARLPGEALVRAGRGAVGSPGPAAPLRALQGHGLGGIRPGRRGRGRGPAGPGRPLAAAARPIHREITQQGYNRDRGAFTQYYGADTLDAAVLLMADVGFLPPDDPRLISTVDTIARELTTGGLVRRYELGADGQSAVDGLPGSEGAFLACSFWLADALHTTGRHDDAVELFERLLGLRNDLGLLSEEYDPRYGRLVGNTPQAFSHMPLIQTALNLDDHAGHHRRRPGSRAPG